MKEANHQRKEFISLKRIPYNSNAPKEIKGSFTRTFVFSFLTYKELLINDLKSGQRKEIKRKEGLTRQIWNSKTSWNDILECKFQIILKFLITTTKHFKKSYAPVIGLMNMYVIACRFTITTICFPIIISLRYFRKKTKKLSPHSILLLWYQSAWKVGD